MDTYTQYVDRLLLYIETPELRKEWEGLLRHGTRTQIAEFANRLQTLKHEREKQAKEARESCRKTSEWRDEGLDDDVTSKQH